MPPGEQRGTAPFAPGEVSILVVVDHAPRVGSAEYGIVSNGSFNPCCSGSCPPGQRGAKHHGYGLAGFQSLL